jgi:hypothetical protein
MIKNIKQNVMIVRRDKNAFPVAIPFKTSDETNGVISNRKFAKRYTSEYYKKGLYLNHSIYPCASIKQKACRNIDPR